VCQVAGLPAYVSSDAASGGIAVGDGSQDRVVQPHVMKLGLGGQQVARLTEQRAGRVQHRSPDPVIKVAAVGGRVIPDEFPPVSGRATDDRVHLDGQCRIRHTPELRG
jgi:hypothetical protein